MNGILLDFRVAKTHKAMEYIKLEWMKQIGLANMRILEGCTSLLQDSVFDFLSQYPCGKIIIQKHFVAQLFGWEALQHLPSA